MGKSFSACSHLACSEAGNKLVAFLLLINKRIITHNCNLNFYWGFSISAKRQLRKSVQATKTADRSIVSARLLISVSDNPLQD